MSWRVVSKRRFGGRKGVANLESGIRNSRPSGFALWPTPSKNAGTSHQPRPAVTTAVGRGPTIPSPTMRIGGAGLIPALSIDEDQIDSAPLRAVKIRTLPPATIFSFSTTSRLSSMRPGRPSRRRKSRWFLKCSRPAAISMGTMMDR